MLSRGVGTRNATGIVSRRGRIEAALDVLEKFLGICATRSLSLAPLDRIKTINRGRFCVPQIDRPDVLPITLSAVKLEERNNDGENS